VTAVSGGTRTPSLQITESNNNISPNTDIKLLCEKIKERKKGRRKEEGRRKIIEKSKQANKNLPEYKIKNNNEQKKSNKQPSNQQINK
jgi:hypothetical protein